MKRLSTLTMLIGLGVFATGACGDDSDGDTHASTSHAGRAGRGGTASGAGGTSAHAGQAGRGGSTALSGKGGTDATASGRGGRAGNGAAGAGRGGSTGGSTGGGVMSGAGGAGETGDAGGGGEGGGPSCFGATAHAWGNITPSGGVGTYAKYATRLESNAFPGRDAVLELWAFLPDTGRFELGTGDNANWATCMQCVVVRVDDVGNPNRILFADAGVLSIDDASDPIAGAIDANLTNAHFVEVTVEGAFPYTSTPVDGGRCLAGVTTHISVDPNTPPDGAGGAAGQGGAGGEGGSAGAFDVPEGCIEVSSGAWISDVQPSYGRYLSSISPNLGSTAADAFILAFFANDVGTSRVGHGVDARFATCERCFLANIQDNTPDGLWFYGVEGTLAVDSGSTPMSGVLDATATNVTFTQVDPYDLETPVTNGECLHLTTATISLP